MNTHSLLYWFRRTVILHEREAQMEREYQALVRRLQGPRLVKAS